MFSDPKLVQLLTGWCFMSSLIYIWAWALLNRPPSVTFWVLFAIGYFSGVFGSG